MWDTTKLTQCKPLLSFLNDTLYLQYGDFIGGGGGDINSTYINSLVYFISFGFQEAIKYPSQKYFEDTISILINENNLKYKQLFSFELDA